MPETITPPNGEPLSVADAKLFLRVENDLEDTLIASLIAAARGALEVRTGRALLSRRLRQRFDAWPHAGGALQLAIGPVTMIHAVSVVTATGSELAIPASFWALDPDADEARLMLGTNPPPQPARALSGIAVEYSAGGTVDAIPPALLQALRLIIAHLYARRDGSDGPEIADIDRLIAPWQGPRL